jgi:MFS family permease
VLIPTHRFIKLPPEQTIAGLPLDFWVFWSGQAVSTLGSSFTVFAIPLLIFRLTGSALNLSLSTAVAYVPYILFGLLIGAWVDRLDRKRLMILVNVLLAVNVGSIPLLAALGHLSVAWIYAVQFVAATLRLFFAGAVAAAIASLVPTDRLVDANGKIQASYSAMGIIGPILAGSLAAFLPIVSLLIVDGASYVVAVGSLLLVHHSFNAPDRIERRPSVRAEIAEGLRFLFAHPILRNISVMMAMVNLVSMTVMAQIVFYAKEQLHATNAQVGLLFSANAAGVVLLSLLAGPLRKRLRFSRLALGALQLQGIAAILLAYVHVLWAALPLMALFQGLGILFSINTTSLRQAITPQRLLGRVVTTAGVMGGAVIPIGTMLGGLALQKTGSVAFVYTAIGLLVFAIPTAFHFSELRHAEAYLPVVDEEAPHIARAG